MRRHATLILSVLLVVTAACAGDDGVSPEDPTTTTHMLIPPESTQATSAPTTGSSMTTAAVTTTATSTPPAVVVPTPGYWPESLREILVANETGVVAIGADGAQRVLDTSPASAAHVDGIGGLVVMRQSIEYKGIERPAIEWIPEPGASPLQSVGPEPRDLLGVFWLPTESRGPRYAASLVSGQPEVGPTTSVRLEAVNRLPRIPVNRVGRRDAEAVITWATWSGRFFVLTLEGPAGETWIEFADQFGSDLIIVHNPVPPGTTGPDIRFATAVGGSNRLLYVEYDPSGYATLVGRDLDGGSEFLRMTLATPSETIIRVDESGGVVAVSRTDGGAYLPPLLIDLASGAVGSIDAAGAATISHDGPLEPVLYPAGTIRDGVEPLPDLVVTSPSDYALVNERVVTFRGEVTPGSTVTAGAYEADVDASGRWELVLSLQPGSNLAVFTATHPGSDEAVSEKVPVYRVVGGDPDRWLGFLFWTPTEDDRPPFGAGIVDMWPHASPPTTLLAYQLETTGLLAIAEPGVPITHSPEMLWLVEELGQVAGGHGWKYVTLDVLVVDPPIGYNVRVDEDGRTVVEFDGRAFLVDAEGGRFIEFDPEA